MSDDRSEAGSQSSSGSVRCLIIVARDQAELFERLRRQVGDHDVRVLLDRRQPESTPSADQHLSDRRRPVSIDKDLRHRQYIIVSPQEPVFEGR